MKAQLLSALERSLTLVGDFHRGESSLHPENHDTTEYCCCPEATLHRDIEAIIKDIKAAPEGLWPKETT